MKTKLQLPLLALDFMLLLLGALFRVLHWAGAEQLLLFGLLGVGLAAVPSLRRWLRAPRAAPAPDEAKQPESL